jgi:hypothetical protein
MDTIRPMGAGCLQLDLYLPATEIVAMASYISDIVLWLIFNPTNIGLAILCPDLGGGVT